MRSSVLVILCSTVLFATLSSAYAYNPTEIGNRPTTACFADQLVESRKVQVHNTGGIGRWTKQTFRKTETFNVGNGRVITMIRICDIKKNGALARVVYGGVGRQSVTLNFEKKAHGFHFVVEVYAINKR